MAVRDRDFYNEASAQKLGWVPQWFGAKEFGDELITKVKEFQSEHGLSADGLVGPVTFRRVYTELEARRELLNSMREGKDEEFGSPHILCGGRPVAIEWEKVVTMRDEGSLALPRKCYKVADPDRKPTMIVTHWDAALSAQSCKKILERRGLSSHFVIDNDGTIFQMVDTNDITWHAGSVNGVSIGIDFSNAFYTKYQRVYRKRGFGNRPLLKSKVHGGTVGEHLGYYEVQLDAYKALLKALCGHYDIPLECPVDEEGELVTAVHKGAKAGKFKGVVCHYHLNRKKIDCAGLELKGLLDDIKTN
tara:strand:+ start:3129 stop:4040 length:912 start_codon:yes stop_codon:yes gene_type:complete